MDQPIGTVVLDIAISMDGFIPARHDDPAQRLGEGGQRLEDWAFARKTDRDA